MKEADYNHRNRMIQAHDIKCEILGLRIHRGDLAERREGEIREQMAWLERHHIPLILSSYFVGTCFFISPTLENF